MKTVLQLLTEGRELISDPKRWTTGEFARDEHERAVFVYDPKAVCWCSVGAIHKVEGPPTPSSGENTWPALRALHAATACRNIAKYNDTHSHAEVLAIWDKAIEQEKANGQV